MHASKRQRLYAAGLTAAIVVGVLLGNSTISSINPAHFSDAATDLRGRGAAALAQAPQPVPLYGAQYSRDEAALIRAAVCPGCDAPATSSVFFYPAAVPYFGSREERALAEVRERRAIDQAYALRERRREEGRARRGMGGPFEPAGIAGTAEAITVSTSGAEVPEERGE